METLRPRRALLNEKGQQVERVFPEQRSRRTSHIGKIARDGAKQQPAFLFRWQAPHGRRRRVAQRACERAEQRLVGFLPTPPRASTSDDAPALRLRAHRRFRQEARFADAWLACHDQQRRRSPRKLIVEQGQFVTPANKGRRAVSQRIRRMRAIPRPQGSLAAGERGEHRTLVSLQTKGVGQAKDRVAMWRALDAALEVADATSAQPSALGQFLL
jgi:hypothetical protein